MKPVPVEIDGELLTKGVCNLILAVFSVRSATKQIKKSGIIEYGVNRVTTLLSKKTKK